MTSRQCQSGAADIVPGNLLWQREAWRCLRCSCPPGSYLIGLPRTAPRHHAMLLTLARLLRQKGHAVHVVLINA